MARVPDKKTTKNTTPKVKLEAREGYCFMKNKQGNPVEILNKPEQIEVLESHGWTKA